MSAYTVTTDPRPPAAGTLLLAALLLVAVAVYAVIEVQSRAHAVARHGAEAVAIRQACEEYGPDYVFKSLSPKDNKYFQVCALDDGRYGLRVIECTARGWMERTAFVAKGALGDGTWERTWEYLSARSTIFKGKLSNVCK